MRFLEMRLVVVLAGCLAGQSAVAQLVEVETYSGDKTYTFNLPGAPSGTGLIFGESLTVNSLSFTPGSVTFRGQPVDFSGTEASFLANSYSGQTTFPVNAGPATVDVGTDAVGAGPALNAPFHFEHESLDLGPGFSSNFLDIVPGIHPKPTVMPQWNSAVVPELNGLPVEQDISESITAVDPVNGIVDVNFSASIFAPELVVVETHTGAGTYDFVLPGAPMGISDLVFSSQLVITSIDFSPGSVTFKGQPVDFDGTEASFLANTYAGDTTIPVVAGPANVDADANMNAAGPALSGGFQLELRDLDLGPGFNQNNFDIPLQSYPKHATMPSWSSPVVPELNGIEVLQSIEEEVVAVDAIFGVVDVVFSGSVLASELSLTPSADVWGIALLLAGLGGSAVILLRRRWSTRLAG